MYLILLHIILNVYATPHLYLPAMNFKYVILFLPVLWQTLTSLKVADEEGKPTCKSYYNATLKKQVFTQAEIEPEFPGGPVPYQRFLSKNLRYPQIDSNDLQELQLSVKIKFIVDTDGQIKNPTVQGKAGTSNLTPLEKEALRVIKLMPNWTPGTCNGKVIPVEVILPLIVEIELNE